MSTPEPRGPSLADRPLRYALDQIRDGFVVYGRDWRFLYLNEAAAKYLGRDRKELLGRVVWEVYPETAGTYAENNLRRAAEQQEPSEYTQFSPAMHRWVAVRVYPAERTVSVSFRDVTDEKRTADELRESEARHRAVFEHAADGMLVTSPAGTIFSANEAACRMLGRTEEEIRAVGRAGIMDPSDPRLPVALEERRRAGHLRAELTCVRKDGTRFPVSVCSSIYVDAEGRERTSMILRDLTEEKRAEDRLRIIADAGKIIGSKLQSDATLHDLTRLLVPRMADLCVVDLVESGTLRRVAASHRVPERDAQLMAPGRLGPIETRDAGPYKVARTGEAELTPIVGEPYLRALARDEAHLAIIRQMAPRSAISVPLVGHAGTLGVITMACIDDARAYDAQDLAAAQAIADRAALAIENARLFEQMVEAKRLRDEVLAVVSHDLRNPLNAISLMAAVLGRRTPSAETTTIAKAVRRADTLIQDLLTAAALEAGGTPLHPEPCALGPIVDEAVELHRPSAEECGVTLAASVEGRSTTVHLDRHRILQLLGNLLGNALKFTEKGGKVSVDATVEEGRVVLRVSDTGAGIPPEALPHVFDRFWQGAHARRAGAGLGLAIAKGIAEGHGGTISVESALGRGTTFLVTLPRPATAPASGTTAEPRALRP